MKPYYEEYDQKSLRGNDKEIVASVAKKLLFRVLAIAAFLFMGFVTGVLLLRYTLVKSMAERLEAAILLVSDLKQKNDRLEGTLREKTAGVDVLSGELSKIAIVRDELKKKIDILNTEKAASQRHAQETFRQYTAQLSQTERVSFPTFYWGLGEINAAFKARWEDGKLFYVLSIGPDHKTVTSKMFVNLINSPYFKISVIDDKEYAIRNFDVSVKNMSLEQSGYVGRGTIPMTESEWASVAGWKPSYYKRTEEDSQKEFDMRRGLLK